MNYNIELISTPLPPADAAGGLNLPAGMAHSSGTPCPLPHGGTLDFSPRYKASCCALRGTPLAIALAQFCNGYLLDQLHFDLDPKATRVLGNDLQSLSEKVHENFLDYLEVTEGDRGRVEVHVPNAPGSHFLHQWHLSRLSFRNAVLAIDDAALWYTEVASRDFGVHHEWRPR